MISGGIELDEIVKIRLLLKVKLGDDPSYYPNKFSSKICFYFNNNWTPLKVTSLLPHNNNWPQKKTLC